MRLYEYMIKINTHMLRYKNYFITNTEFYRGLYHIIDKIQDVVGMQ